MKKCRVCNIEKSESKFEGSINGKTTNRCKSCKNEKTREQYRLKMLIPENREKEKQRGRENYYRLEKRKDTYNRNSQLKWKSKYPEKLAASIKSRNLVRKIKGSHFHHWSYNEEHYKDVIELSVKDHNIVHRHIIYDQERKMYRVAVSFGLWDAGTLLDTKERSVNFYNEILFKQ